jgi:hypothetical protein
MRREPFAAGVYWTVLHGAHSKQLTCPDWACTGPPYV